MSTEEYFEGMSDEVKVLLIEIEALCKKHGLMLSVSGYDTLQVWPARKGTGTLYFPGIEDCTDTGSE